MKYRSVARFASCVSFVAVVAVALSCGAFAAAGVSAQSVTARVKVERPRHHVVRRSALRSHIERPNDHVHYAVELEPHLQMQWTDLPYRTSVGFGLGGRASIPVLQQGPIPSINNNLAISFGFDWAHFSGCRPFEPGCSGDDFWFPVTVQWNFFLTPAWSVFPEVGFAIHHAAWGWDVDGPNGPRGRGRNDAFVECSVTGFCTYSDRATSLAFATWLGTRWSLSDSFSFVLRLGVPSFTAGVSFRI